MQKAEVHVQLKPGIFGVRVRIMPPDTKFPDKIQIVESLPAEEKKAEQEAEEEAEVEQTEPEEAKTEADTEKTETEQESAGDAAEEGEANE
jgi:small subunit ribosomal protein S3